MAISGVTGAGVQGVQNGLRQAEDAAQRIARNGATEPADAGGLAEAAIDLKQAETQVKASAKVVEAADDMLGSLLDTRA